MCSTFQPLARELWDALFSCDVEAILAVISRSEKDELKNVCEMLVPSNLLWHSEIKDQLSALHYIAMIGYVDILYELIWRFEGLDLNVQSGQYKWTPLHHAIYGGHEHVVRLLLSNKVQVDTRDKDGVTGLHLAVSGGYFRILEQLLQYRAKANVQDLKGDAPLHVCLGLLGTSSKGVSERERLQMVECLLKAGASVSLMNNLGDTAVHTCLRYRHGGRFCRLLLGAPEAKSSLKVTNDMGHIPLQVAEDVETLEILLLQGSNIDFQGPDGRTVLHMRATRPELVTLLLDYKADANIVDKQGRTPLHVALCDGEAPLESICHLLMSMCDVNIKDNSGNTPLHLASRLRRNRGFEDPSDPIIDLLINQGAMVNIRNNNGETPLFISVRHANYRQAAELMHAGGSPLLADNKGLTPAMLDPRWGKKVFPKQKDMHKILPNGDTNTANNVSKGHTSSSEQITNDASSTKSNMNLDDIWWSSKGKPKPNPVIPTSSAQCVTEKRKNLHPESCPNKDGDGGQGIKGNEHRNDESVMGRKCYIGGVSSVRKQFASLQGEVASFKTILEKCADPKSELTDDDLLALIEDDSTDKPELDVPEDMCYLRKEVMTLAQELEDAYLDE